MAPSLVLFDLDGTLADTAPDIADAVNRVLAAHGLPALPEPWIRDRIGNGSRALLEHAWAAVARWPGNGGALVHEFAAHYAACCGRRGAAYPGALETLGALRAAGVRCALLTNKEERFARRVLEAYGLSGLFDIEVFGDSLPAKKPDPLPIRHALDRLGVPAAQALLVGDSAIDVATARNAGIAVWAVSYGYNGGTAPAALEADHVIHALGEVAEAYSPRASSSSLYLRNSPRNW
jgi:phosphoglycolate phosphatase